jgi:hypothetical protein
MKRFWIPNARLLAILKDAEQTLHNLKNRFPCGIKRIDDETDAKIARTKLFIEDFKVRYQNNRG